MMLDRGLQPPDQDDRKYDVVENLLIWVTKNYSPEEVYSFGELESWALKNGFIKPSDECKPEKK